MHVVDIQKLQWNLLCSSCEVSQDNEHRMLLMYLSQRCPFPPWYSPWYAQGRPTSLSDLGHHLTRWDFLTTNCKSLSMTSHLGDECFQVRMFDTEKPNVKWYIRPQPPPHPGGKCQPSGFLFSSDQMIAFKRNVVTTNSLVRGIHIMLEFHFSSILHW